MYKALLIDLDNTILDFTKCEYYAIKPVMEKYNIPVTEENINTYSKINLANWKRLEKKEITREECVTTRWETFFGLFGIKADGKDINDLYFSKLKQGGYIMPGAIEFLEKITKIMPVYALTNGIADVQHSRLNNSEVKRYLAKVYISEEIGYTKPDPNFFNYVMKDINVNKEDCIMLGDSMSSDIAGAINARIDNVWFDFKNTNPNYEGNRITKLEEFFRFLD